MAYDFGTTSLKAALVDTTGRILAHASELYPLFQLRVGWAEQNPRSLWDAGARAGRRALEQSGLSPDAVRSVVFVAPWKGIIPVGKDGEVLRDAIIWMDSRATAEANRLNERAGEFILAPARNIGHASCGSSAMRRSSGGRASGLWA
jgi:xylulokinase